jgi:hypothetical protein
VTAEKRKKFEQQETKETKQRKEVTRMSCRVITPDLTFSRLCLSFVTFVPFCSFSLVSDSCVRAAEIDFEKQVAPILTAHCLRCHNAEKARAGLNLASRASAAKGSDAGEVLVPGKPAESLLTQRAADGSMPPETDGRRLTAEEVAVLAAWVKAGAKWPAGRVLSSPARIEESSSVPTGGYSPGGRRSLVARIRHYLRARRNLAAAEERGSWRAAEARIDGGSARPASIEEVGERPRAAAAREAEGDERQCGKSEDFSHGNSP